MKKLYETRKLYETYTVVGYPPATSFSGYINIWIALVKMAGSVVHLWNCPLCSRPVHHTNVTYEGSTLVIKHNSPLTPDCVLYWNDKGGWFTDQEKD